MNPSVVENPSRPRPSNKQIQRMYDLAGVLISAGSVILPRSSVFSLVGVRRALRWVMGRWDCAGWMQKMADKVRESHPYNCGCEICRKAFE